MSHVGCPALPGMRGLLVSARIVTQCPGSVLWLVDLVPDLSQPTIFKHSMRLSFSKCKSGLHS